MANDPEPAIVLVRCSDVELTVHLEDGRVISVPLWWYPRLSAAGAEERKVWELLPGGVGIHWPLLDEDLSLNGILSGTPSPGARPPAGTGS